MKAMKNLFNGFWATFVMSFGAGFVYLLMMGSSNVLASISDEAKQFGGFVSAGASSAKENFVATVAGSVQSIVDSIDESIEQKEREEADIVFAQEAGVELPDEEVMTEVVEEDAVVINDNKKVINLPSGAGDVISTVTVSLPEEGKAIVADLDQMKIFLYENAEEVGAYPILSKGRPGSAWETPPGEYEIKSKKQNHFSSIGEVWMPYSMQFFGNYFIHGWPHYSDGTPVSEGYSGGCIRLSNEEVQQIYEFASLGTDVFIVGDQDEASEGDLASGFYVFQTYSQFPRLTADAYVVADIESGTVISKRNEEKVYSIASISKLLTALTSLEVVNQFKDTVISQDAVDTYGYQGNLELGEVIEVRELLYPLLLTSSNDAAEAIAEAHGREAFMASMNGKAASIGLFDTSFEDPSGLSDNNVSTALDLFRLTQYINDYKRYIFDVTMLKKYETDDHAWYTNSPFKNDKRYQGGKNGYTDEAQKTYVGVFSTTLKSGEKKDFAIILLKASDTTADVKNTLRFIENSVSFEYFD